jgi:tetratricopeptide (TPR) repeat protein
MRGDIAAALAGGFMKAALPQLNDDDGRLLARVLMGTDDGDVERRDDVVLRALSALSCGRRSVVILDDAHLGDDALAFAQRLLARPSTTTEAVVVVLAVADEALVERAHAHAAVIDLERDPRVQSLSLRPLLPADHRRLVEDLLGLEPGLADVVAARTAGNPRFAVELVGDFVERGVLELAPSWFALRRGEPATLPDTVHAAWSTRLLRLLSTLPGDARHCLELGAVLGADGDTAAWIAVCEAAGIDSARDVVERLVDALERARFVVVDPPGSARFTHAMLRESMLRLADDGGRLLQHHRSVASWLSTRPGHRKQERRARHLLLAGDLDDAVPVLCTAASSALLTDGPSRAMQLVDELFSALDNAGVADVDPRRLRAVALRARVLAAAGRYDESAMWAGLVDDNAPLLAQLDGLRARALTAQRRGEHDLAAELFQSMLVLADDDSATPAHVAGEADAVDEALLGLADGLYRQGRLDDAAAVFGRALLRASWRADDEAVASCLWSLSTVSLWRGNPAMARALVLRAQKVARRAGLRTLTAFGRSALGDVERIAGEPAEARHHYVEAARQLAGAGSARLRAVELNLALCDIADDNHAAAGERASRLLGVLDAAGEGALSSLCHGVLALTSARASDWSAADAHLAVFLTPWSQGVVDGEHALLAEAFARVAIQQGDVWRAVVANSCAREVWTSLGRQDRIDALPVV